MNNINNMNNTNNMKNIRKISNTNNIGKNEIYYNLVENESQYEKNDDNSIGSLYDTPDFESIYANDNLDGFSSKVGIPSMSQASNVRWEQNLLPNDESSYSENILNSILSDKAEVLKKRENFDTVDLNYNNTYNNGLINNVNDSLNNIVYLLNKKATNAIINFEISFIQIVSVIIILLLIVDIYIRVSDNKSFYKRKY
jgi:hypothetical protein